MKKKIFVILLVVLAVLLIGSCDLFGPGFNETEITGTGTSGTWTFGSGTCSGTSGSTYSVHLYPVTGDDYIMFSALSSDEPETLTINLFDMDNAKTVTYYDGSSNYIIIDGYRQVTVDETAGTAVVKLNIYDNTNNLSFNGTVTLDVTTNL